MKSYTIHLTATRVYLQGQHFICASVVDFRLVCWPVLPIDGEPLHTDYPCEVPRGGRDVESADRVFTKSIVQFKAYETG